MVSKDDYSRYVDKYMHLAKLGLYVTKKQRNKKGIEK